MELSLKNPPRTALARTEGNFQDPAFPTEGGAGCGLMEKQPVL